MKNQVQLITYVDRLAHDLKHLRELLAGCLRRAVRRYSSAPFFNPTDGADAGFDPVDHTEIDSRLGTWEDVRNLGEDFEIVADLIVNHISSDSRQFRDFSEQGATSRFAKLFLTYNRVFPGGASAGSICVVLIVTASLVRYPHTSATAESVDLKHTLRMMANPYALGLSGAIFLYVAVESAIYVWMPTLLGGYHGSLLWIATYAISIFFVLRAAGRFIGSWTIARLNWAAVVTAFSFAIFSCFVVSMLAGVGAAVLVLPLSGVFMSVLYPTLNSKGISCFRKHEHGAVASVILFFTCVSAVAGPLGMAAISDHFGDPKYGFLLATGFAGLLFASLLLNWILNPTREILSKLDATEYQLMAADDVVSSKVRN